MIFDLNMWKNQVFYKPENYGQYVATEHRVFTVTNEDILNSNNKSLWTAEARSQIIPHSIPPVPYMDGRCNIFICVIK